MTEDLDAIYYTLGKRVLGKTAGGMLTKLRNAGAAKSNPDDPKGYAWASLVLGWAKGKQDPREYVGKVLAQAKPAKQDNSVAWHYGMSGEQMREYERLKQAGDFEGAKQYRYECLKARPPSTQPIADNQETQQA